jgi:glutathione synthase/RimK-type ligase-like ATP-grasp enzyme
MPQPRIAIASCTGYEAHKADEELLLAALRQRGCEAASVPWDDPAADWGGFDLCLVKSTWDYNRKYEEFLAWARRVEAVAELRNPADLIAWNSNKTYLRGLGERGVRTVPTVWVGRESETRLQEILAAEGWEQAVVKPVVDLGAENLRRVRAGDEEGEPALTEVLRRHDAMVQPFLPSLEEQGETSLIYIDGTLTHAVRKRPAPGDFRVQEIWGGTRERIDPEAGQVELAERARAQLDSPPLYARVDIVEGLDGAPCLIELELIEPNLYLGEHPEAAEAMADALLRIDVDA